MKPIKLPGWTPLTDEMRSDLRSALRTWQGREWLDAHGIRERTARRWLAGGAARPVHWQALSEALFTWKARQNQVTL